MIESIVDIIRTHGSERPAELAFVLGDRTVSFGELDDRSSRVANALAAAGTGPGDRVAILDKNGLEFFDLMFGSLKLNAVIAPVNWRLAPPEVSFIVNDAAAVVLVVGEEFVPVLEEIEGELTTVKQVVVVGSHPRHPSFEDWLGSHDATDPGATSAPGDVAVQFYSSGTTGLPKGVQLTNRNCLANLENTEELLRVNDHTVSMIAMPQFHVAGGFWALFALYYGRPGVIEREVDPVAIIEDLARHKVTHTVFVPALMQVLVAMPGIREADLSSMEYLVYGASPISEEVLRASIEVFGCNHLQAYGMTETSGGVVLLPPEDHDLDGPNLHRLRAAGLPGPGSEVRVVDPDTLADRAVGEVGEILIRSEQNTIGYWNRPEATAELLVEGGWLRTSDAGYLDADGYLYIHDRMKDMIISGGENVYPAEVENRLMSHPAVADVAVIGVPDDRWGETPKAIVVLKAGEQASAGDLIAWCRAGLAHYKCPTSVDWIPELPRNPSGKILKTVLREPYWAGRDRRVG